MKKRMVIVALPLLASCAGDNPENPPLYGEWEMVTKVDSVMVDGIVFDRSQLPQSFLQLEGAETLCGEPMFIDRNWQRRDIEQKVNSDCTIENFDHSARRTTLSGRCSMVDKRAQFSPDFNASVSHSADRFRLVVTLSGTANVPGSDGKQYIEAIAVQSGRRTGDC